MVTGFWLGGRSAATSAAVGIAVGVLVVAMLLAPFQGASTTSGPAYPQPHSPALVDPQFLPAILTGNSSTDTYFGSSVAASGSTVAVGAPGEELYLGGLEAYGQVHLENTATGATAILRGPSSGGGELGFGASVAMTGSRIVVGAPGMTNGAGGAFVYAYALGTGNVLQVSLLASFSSPDASESSPDGNFGNSVAISGHLVAVGAPGELVSGLAEAGHAYIFNLITGAVTMLSSPAPQADGQFGESVAISGNTVVVGAQSELNATDVDVGNAYVFAASTGDLITTLTNPDPFSDDLFGHSVAINGTTVLVGAPLGFGPSYESGVAYEYNLASDVTTTIESPVPQLGGYFGFSVAVDSSTILVGAPFEVSGGAADAGNAYLFSVASGGLVTSAFSAPNWPPDGSFGDSVAESGAASVIVGAPFETAEDFSLAGHAYVFSQIPLTVAAPSPQANGDFGRTVSINGTIVMGAPNQTVASLSGAGQVYYMASDTSPIVSLTSPSPQAGARFGDSVAASSSFVVVGSPGEAGSAGAVYVYSVSSGALLYTIVGAPGSLLGTSVAVNANLVAAGAPDQLNSGISSGGAYVFNMSSDLLTTFTNPVASESGAEFGDSVSISGNQALIGAPYASSDAGVAYLFNVGTPGTPTATLSDPTGQAGDFGTSVALEAGTAVVGAPGDEVAGVSDAGLAFTFSAATGGDRTTLNNPAPLSGGLFGLTLAINDGTIAVGAPAGGAYGVPVAGDVYLYGLGSAAPSDRYNSPYPTTGYYFGASVAIGSGGRLAVGEDISTLLSQPGNAYIFFF